MLWIILLFVLLVLLLGEIEFLIGSKPKSNRDVSSPSLLPYRGGEIARASRIVICGLCRNISPVNLSPLQDIGKRFLDYRIILYENDSVDDTRRDIQRQAELDNRVVLLENTPRADIDTRKTGYEMGALSEQRMHNMAYFREQYLTHVKKFYRDWDYMLVMDMDLNHTDPKNGLFDSLEMEDSWDAIFCNGRFSAFSTFYGITVAYDGIAFELEHRKGDGVWNMLLNIIHMNWLINRSQGMIPVRSAFNGMGIYKIPSILSASYIATSPDTATNRCEHKVLIDSGNFKCFINPAWKIHVSAQGPGSLMDHFFGRWFNKLNL